MAHRGRIYPLAFRRDFCLNVNNFRSVALSYLVPLSGYGGVAGTASNGITVELKNPTYVTLGDIYRYESDPYAAGVYTVFHSINWDFINTGTTQRVQWTVHETTLGVIFQSAFITSNADPDGGFFDLTSGFFQTPGVWTKAATQAQFFAPKPY